MTLGKVVAVVFIAAWVVLAIGALAQFLVGLT